MYMRTLLNLIESHGLFTPNDTAADRFIQAASRAIDHTYGDTVFVRFVKAGPALVRVADDMQGIRTKRSWAILRTLTDLAAKYGVKMNIQGAAGRFPG